MTRPEFPYDLTQELRQKAFVSGLDDFTKGLERLFFASVDIRRGVTENGKEQLVLEMHCPLTLVEALYHFNQGNWGVSCARGVPSHTNQSLSFLLETLNQRNEEAFEISEVLLEFTDILLVLQPSGLQPLASVMPMLLEQISHRYIAISHGMQTSPQEIYIPVRLEQDPGDTTQSQPDGQSAYRYWALYFEDSVDGQVYDSITGEWINGDILLYDPTENNPD